MADQSEVLFEAIQTIVDKTIEDIHFDKTITCTVIDASKADNDEYTVTDGSIEFTATGNGVKYNKNARVYVTVPQGDFSQQKVIIGKLKKDESFSYNYIAPFDRFVQGMDFNKQKQNIKDRSYGTNTNVGGKQYFEELIFKILPEGTEEEITDNVIVAKKGSIPISGYDRLGVRATFRSFNIQSGNYGLLIKLYNNPKKEPLAKLKINANTDMFGNIYNFSTYMPQEKIFDLSSIKDEITSIEVYFFTENIVIEGKDFPDDLDILSVKNIELIFGYDAESKFKENSLLLYSKNGEKYDANNPQSKILAIADIKNENGQFTVNRNIDSGQKFRWYRWNIFKQNENGEYEINASDNYWKEIESQNSEIYEFSPNYDLEYEQIRVDLIDENGNVIKSSNILRLDNADENIQMKNIAGLVQNLKLTTDNDGSFFIYNSNGMLLNPSDRTRRRKLYAEYKSITTGFNDLDGSEDIFWEIPKSNSMLTPIIRNDSYEYLYNFDEGKQRKCSFKINLVNSTPAGIISDTNKYNYYKVEELKIEEQGTKPNEWNEISSVESGTFKDDSFYIEYNLNDFYSQQRINNSVSCFIIRNGSVYKATKNFTFGITGNNGSKNTLVAEIVTHDFSATKTTIDKNGKEITETKQYSGGLRALTSKKNSSIYCRFQLRNQENNNIPNLTYNITPDPGNDNDLGVDDEQFYYYRITGNNATILTCTVQYEGQNFETKLPIPCAEEEYNNFIYQGPEYIIYDSGNSNPNYYKDELKLFDSELNEKEGLKWDIKIYNNNNNNQTNNNISDKYLLSMFPKIQHLEEKDSYKVISPTIYTKENENEKYFIYLIAKLNDEEIWKQPLIMMATPYGSPLLNQWDGQLLIDEENNTIMSSIIGAGRKDSNNRFSGVLMGEIGQAAQGGTVTSQTTGLLGFDKGIQTFKLDTNGQMTIGATGQGQIEINGNSGSIKSKNFDKTNNTGMEINLTDINFNMGGRITMDGSDDENKPYFAIKHIDKNSTNSKFLLNIGKNNTYFLQSQDYNPSDYKGFKLDLGNNKIEGYNAKISFSNKNLETGIWTRTILGSRFSARKDSKNYDVVTGLTEKTEEENINTMSSGNTNKIKLDFAFIPMFMTRYNGNNYISYSQDKGFETHGSDYYSIINSTNSKISFANQNFKYIGSSVDEKCCYQIVSDNKPSKRSSLVLYKDYNNFNVLFKLILDENEQWHLNFYSYENNNFYNVKTGEKVTGGKGQLKAATFYNDSELQYGTIIFKDENNKISYQQLYNNNSNSTNNELTNDVFFVAISSSFKTFDNNSLFQAYGDDDSNKESYQWCQIEDLYTTESDNDFGYKYWVENVNWFKDTSVFLKGKSFNVEVGKADELKPLNASESLHLYTVETVTVESGKVKKDEQNKKWFYVDSEETKIIVNENDENETNSDFFVKDVSSKTNKLVIDSSQALYPFNINSKFKIAWDGTFEATAGTIGGWLVDSNKLVSNNGAVGMARFAGYNRPIFWAGGTSKTYEDSSWTDKVAFGVSGNGKLYSNDAHIGGWILNNDKIQGSGEIWCNNYYGQNQGDANFHGTADKAKTSNDYQTEKGKIITTDNMDTKLNKYLKNNDTFKSWGFTLSTILNFMSYDWYKKVNNAIKNIPSSGNDTGGGT